MSAQNVELVRGGFERFAHEGVEGILDLLHQEFTMVVPPELSAEPDTYVGHDGLRRWFGGFDGLMEEVRFDVHEIIDVGDDRVIIDVHLCATGKESGIEVDQGSAQVWSIRDGKLARAEVFADLATAKAAAGV